MSLWLESMCQQVDSVGDGTDEESCRARARIVLAFHAMPVPGTVVRKWLQSPEIAPEFLMELLPSSLRVLHRTAELQSFDAAQLLALSMEPVDDDRNAASLSDPHAHHTLHEYVEAANRHLAEHPQLRKLAALVR